MREKIILCVRLKLNLNIQRYSLKQEVLPFLYIAFYNTSDKVAQYFL